jgi:hypothetical protein
MTKYTGEVGGLACGIHHMLMQVTGFCDVLRFVTVVLFIVAEMRQHL